MPKFKHLATNAVVEAIQLTATNSDDVVAFTKASSMKPAGPTGLRVFTVPCRTGRPLLVELGNWIVRKHDDLDVWNRHQFEAHFEEMSMAVRDAHRERAPLNLWDGFNPREFLASTNRGSTVRGDHSITLRLFGNRNVGTNTRSNLLMAGQVPRDESYVVTNWYARTNVHTLPAEFHAFAHSAIVTLVVGQKTRHAAPLADLLARKDGDINVKTRGEEREISDALAQNMYDEVYPTGSAPWHGLPLYEQEHWRRVSRVAHGMVTPAVLALIPERQTYSVSVSVDRRALGRLLEVLPTDTAPESLIWLHLEGVRRV